MSMRCECPSTKPGVLLKVYKKRIISHTSTPDSAFDVMIIIWNGFQSFISSSWIWYRNNEDDGRKTQKTS